MYAPAPVYYEPAPAYYQPAPVVYGSYGYSPYYYSRHHGYHGYYRQAPVVAPYKITLLPAPVARARWRSSCRSTPTQSALTSGFPR